METLVPKLVAEDIPLLNSLLHDVFPGVEYQQSGMEALRAVWKYEFEFAKYIHKEDSPKRYYVEYNYKTYIL
jgi:dynein heavy chain 1